MPVMGKAHGAHGRANPQPIEDRQRSGIQRVAAELVARERGAIDQTHAHAGARERECGDAAGRPGADDQHVGVACARHELAATLAALAQVGHRARPSTSALFFDPNPRQLHSAASTSAGARECWE